MEELAGQQEKIEESLKGGHNGSKEDWKNECSLSSFLKHSCLLCWTSPRDTDIVETDERVLAKAAEIRELEKALSVENIELQEQQTDCKELEETLAKLEKHKDKLIQQIKTTRQLCYEESQQILSLQAEEVQKESQAEEYERELARARWRLRKLREEVKQTKRKVEEAGERNTPLQDSIRQSYEEILQEEHVLCCLSGGAVTPESQLEESTSPANTTEDEPLPMRPWGRSQSLPAYVDLIMMNKHHMEDDPEERNISNKGETEKGKKECTINPNSLSYLDFYQEDPFSHCQSDHYLFNEHLFSNTDLSDGFTSDPFKGSNPFSAEFFPEVDTNTEKGTENVCDTTSLSCAENKASTGTQCFESEFPDEDSDIEISYSPDELEAMTVVDESCGFKPIQSSSEELGLDAIKGWRTHGQYSEESDPNGYELDLGTISPPSDTQEQNLGSLAGQATPEQTTELEEGSVSAQMVAELKNEVLLEAVQSCDTEQTISGVVSSTETTPESSQNSPDFHNRSDPNKKLDFELSYVPSNQNFFDPYGFKLSPEHVSHTLLDLDEVLLDPEPTEIDTFKFKIITSKNIQCSDPYGFKLSPEEDNQEMFRLCGHDNPEAMDLLSYDNNDLKDSSNYSNKEILEPENNEKEVLEYCSPTHEMLDLYQHGNCEVLESTSLVNLELNSNENSQLLVISQDSSVELLEPCNWDNQEMRGHTGKLMDLMQKDDEDIGVSGSHDDQELVPVGGNENQGLLELGTHDPQVELNENVLTETNNNKCTVKPQLDVRPRRDSSDCYVASEDRLVSASEDQLVSEFDISTTKDLDTFNASAAQSFIEGDLASVFEAGGYIACPDVADDIESLEQTQTNTVSEPVKPFKPIRPPRPSLRAQQKDYTQAQGIDLK